MLKVLLYGLATFMETGIGVWIFGQMFPKRSMETEKDKTVWKIILIILLYFTAYSFCGSYLENNIETKKTILIIEDDADISRLLYTALSKAGYDAVQAYSGTEGRMLLGTKEKRFALILLDLMLPGMSGEELLSGIRSESDIPVIVLTAKDELDDKISVLTGGADDYITKPFEIPEVLARIQVQLRHAAKEQESDRLTYRDMVLDKTTRQVMIEGTPLPKITKQEFAILELLIRHPKQVYSKEDIFEYAWEEPYIGETKTLDVHISNIRKKIKAVTSDEYIETVWGIGYRLHP